LASKLDPPERSDGLPVALPEWRWIQANRHDVVDAVASLRVHLEPAPQPFIRQLLARLFVVCKAPSGASSDEARIRTAEMLRLLGHYPADIWQEAADDWMRSSGWYPTVADLEAIMRPLLGERTRMLSRGEDILAARKPDRPQLSGDEKLRVDGKIARFKETLGPGWAAWSKRLREASRRGRWKRADELWAEAERYYFEGLRPAWMEEVRG
jgi:hypothetical protein